MDNFTFSNTKAGQILVEEIDKIADNGKTRSVISSILDKYFKGLKDIQDIKDEKTRRFVCQLWRDNYIQKIESRLDFPDKIKSFAKNVIKTKLKEYLHIPNEETKTAIREAELDINLTKVKDIDELFKELDA